MHSPYISIIIPVYNVKPYLRQCLDSILVQNEESWEAIVVDDGSTDGSSEICDEYANKDSRFRVFHKENGGVSSARNIGLDQAQGEWIWFVDADDWITSESIAILSDIIKLHPCDTILSGFIYVSEEGNTSEELHECDYWSDKESFLLKHVCYQNGMILFSKIIIQQNHLRFTEGIKMGEDLEFQYKYYLLCERPIRIKESLYFYRHREGSAQNNPNSLLNSIDSNSVILENLLIFTAGINNKGLDWLGPRIVERIKDLMKAAALSPEIKTSPINRIVRKYVHEYKNLGYKGFNNIMLVAACFDVRIYYLVFKIIKKWKIKFQ